MDTLCTRVPLQSQGAFMYPDPVYHLLGVCLINYGMSTRIWQIIKPLITIDFKGVCYAKGKGGKHEGFTKQFTSCIKFKQKS